MRLAVVGAGPAGCAAAYKFSEKGHQVVLFEKDLAPGGRSLSYRSDGFCLDTGAAFFTNFYSRFMNLARDLGYESSIRKLIRSKGLHHHGRTAQINVNSVTSFLRFPFLTLNQKVRIAAWTARLRLQRQHYDLAEPKTLRDVDHCSIEDYAVEQVGKNAYHTLIRSSIEPFWYFRCEDASAALLIGLTSQASGASFYYLDGGMDQMCQEMARRVELRCQSEVISVACQDDKPVVRYRHGQQETAEEFDRVVLASTASVALKLISDLPLSWVSDSQRTFLASQRYASNIHAIYRLPKSKGDLLADSVIPCGPGNHKIASLSVYESESSNSVNKSETFLSIRLSDEVSRSMMSLEEDAIFETSLKLAQGLVPGLLDGAKPFHLVKRAEAIPVHDVGRYRLADDFQREQQIRSGPILFCGDYLSTATLEGAIATGITLEAL